MLFLAHVGPLLLYLHQSHFRWMDSWAYFPCSLFLHACHGKIRLDDVMWYENKRQKDIRYDLRDGGVGADFKNSSRVNGFSTNPAWQSPSMTFKENSPSAAPLLTYFILSVIFHLSTEQPWCHVRDFNPVLYPQSISKCFLPIRTLCYDFLRCTNTLKHHNNQHNPPALTYNHFPSSLLALAASIHLFSW